MKIKACCTTIDAIKAVHEGKLITLTTSLKKETIYHMNLNF
jgi:hypothetical protein